MNKKNVKVNFVKSATEFVGIKIENDSFEIYVPQVFREENDSKVNNKNLLLFLKSLSIAKTLEKEKVKNNKDEVGNVWPIDSYLWIIRDYLENGYFYNREKIYSKNQGKIDWKKTLKTTPIISNGNIIYNELVTTKMSASNDIIAQIYRLCLKHAINKIGWAFEYNIHVDANQYKSNNEMIYLIKKEMTSTFEDIKRLRFKHMLNILQNVESDNALSNNYSYGIKNYYYVYEQMIDIFFKGIKQKKRYNPNGYWILNNEEKSKASSLRPDTIYKRNDETFIIDAKFYQYGATHDIDDLPQTESMQKQITYGDYICNEFGEEKVRNVFILPYNKFNKDFINDKNIERYNDSNLVYIGKAFVSWRDKEQNKAHDYIYAFLIDFNYLLNHYNYDEKEYIETLCDVINKKIEEMK